MGARMIVSCLWFDFVLRFLVDYVRHVSLCVVVPPIIKIVMILHNDAPAFDRSPHGVNTRLLSLLTGHSMPVLSFLCHHRRPCHIPQ